jgi:hypothetical protein
MLSSSLLGDSALQIANSAYIRSAVLLIYTPSELENKNNGRRGRTWSYW